MATGRTTSKHARVYGNGVTLCEYTRSIGPLVHSYAAADLTTMCDSVRGFLPDVCTITASTLNGVMDADAAGLRVLAQSGSLGIDFMIPIGIRAAPAVGDPTFTYRGRVTNYTASIDGGAATVTCSLPAADASDLMAYDMPWGRLLHAYGAETGANSTTGAGVDNGAATSTGGYMMYQVFAGNGTATISIDDSADDTTYGALSGATTGVLNFSTAQAGIIELGKTATIKRYTRWQLTLGGATTVTFALALVRGR